MDGMGRGEKAQETEQKSSAAASVDVPDLSPLVELAFKRVDVLDGSKKTENVPAPLQAAAHRLGYVQATLSNLTPALIQDNSLTLFKGDGKGAGNESRNQEQTRKVREALADESRAGKFGPTTKVVYASYVSWLEDKAIPRELARQKAYGMPFYPSDSFTVDGKTGKVSLQIDASSPPFDRDVKRLNGAIDWLTANQQASDKKEKEVEAVITAQVNSAVKDLGLPRGWVNEDAATGKSAGDADDKWLENSTRLTGLALKAGDYIELSEDLKKATSGKFQLDLPAGTTLVRDEKGKLSRIHLDLPSSWKLESAADKAKLAALEKWVNDKGAVLEPIKEQLFGLKTRPELSISKDDLEVSDGSVNLDDKGSVTGFVGSNKYNLSTSALAVDRKGEEVTVRQSVQLKNVPVWGYLNMIGVADVGKPINIERHFKADDYVVVRKGHEYDLVQAKELSSNNVVDILRQAGEKILPAAMDGGMTTLGVLDVVGAAKGRNPEAFLQVGRGLLRTVAGGTGVFNNAGARETTWGADLNTARSAYFLTDITYGMARSAVRAAGTRMLAQKAASGEVQAAELLAQRAIKKLPLGIEAGSVKQRVYTAGGATMYGAAIGYAPYVYSDLWSQTIRAWNDPTRIIKKQAERQ